MTVGLSRRVVSGMFLGLGLFPYRACAATGGGGYGRTFYVANAGSDQNNGSSPTAPFRSLAAANRLVGAGDTILLQCGSVWRESFVANAVDLRLASYGSGPLPVVTGADRLDTLLTRVGSASTWQAALVTEPTQVFVDNARGRRVATAKQLAKYRDWHWAGSKLTVFGKTDGSRPSVDASVRDVPIDANGYPGLVVDGLRLERARRHDIVLGASDRPTVRGCEIFEAFQNGIEFGTDLSHNDGLIEDNKIGEHGQTGISGGGRMSGWLIRNNAISGCGRLHNEMVGSVASQTWTAGLKLWGWAQDGLQGSVRIEGNTISDCRPHAWAPASSQPHCQGCGIWIDEVFSPSAAQVISGNIVVDCQSRGIYLEKSDNCTVSRNTVDHCGNALYTAGLSVQGSQGRGCARNLVEKNTVRGGWWASEIGGNDIKMFVNNIIRNNIFCGGVNQNIYAVGGGANCSGLGQGNVYQGNCVDRERSNFLTWINMKSTLGAFEAASSGYACNNIAVDPMLSATASGELALGAGSACLNRAVGGGHIGAWQG